MGPPGVGRVGSRVPSSWHPQMCSTRVAIFERQGHTATMPRTSPPTERVVATMALLAERPDASLSLAELTRRLDVNKSTGHAILTSLAAAGWVLRDPTRKTYRLGPAMVALGRQAGASFPALDFARTALVALSREFAATCARARRGRRRGHRARPGRRPALPPAASEGAFRVGAVVPVASAPRRGGGGVGIRRGARRLAGTRAARHPRPLRRRARRHPRPWLRGRDLGHARSRASASSRGLLGDDDTSARAGARPPRRRACRPRGVPRVDLDPDRRARGQRVNAPVFDHTGDVTLVLSLTGFAPRACADTEVLRRRRRPPRRHPRHHRRPLPRHPVSPTCTNISKLTVTYLRGTSRCSLLHARRSACRGRSGAACRRAASVSSPSRTMARAVHQHVLDAVGLGVEPAGAAGQVHAHAHVVARRWSRGRARRRRRSTLLDPAALAQAVELRRACR